MCGIVHIKRLDSRKAFRAVKRSYRKQQNRGKEGFGFVEINKGKVGGYARTSTEEDVIELLNKTSCDEIMFHHRFPTSTPNIADCNHPIYVSHKELKHDYYVVHNGVITNPDTFREDHLEAGFVYQTEVKTYYKTKNEVLENKNLLKYNDSEALAIELALDLNREESERKGHNGIYGSIAFICLQVDKTTKNAIRLYFGRNDKNPLKLLWKEREYIAITSEGDGEEVPANKLCCYDYVTKSFLEPVDYKVGYSYTYQSSYYQNKYGFSNKELELYNGEKDTKQNDVDQAIKEWEEGRDLKTPAQVIRDESYYEDIDACEEYYKAWDDRTRLYKLIDKLAQSGEDDEEYLMEAYENQIAMLEDTIIHPYEMREFKEIIVYDPLPAKKLTQ